MKIALTSVTVNNPVEAFTFYTEVLGFVCTSTAMLLEALRYERQFNADS